MSDEKPEGPLYIKTKEIPAVQVPGNTLDAVLTEMRAMRSEHREAAETLNEKVDTLTMNVELLQNDAQDTKLRLGRVERRQDEHDERAKNSSIRAKSVTENDTKQDSAIGTLVTDVASLKESQKLQLAILERLDKVAASPMVRRVAYAVGVAILGYLTAKGYLSK